MSLDERDYLKDDLYKMEVSYKENGELVFLDKTKSSFKIDEELEKFPDLRYLKSGWEFKLPIVRIFFFSIWFLSFISSFFVLNFLPPPSLLVYIFIFICLYVFFIKIYSFIFVYLIDLFFNNH